MDEQEAPITRLTMVEYFGYAADNYDAAEALVNQIANASGIAVTQIIDEERGDQVISLLSLAMGPVDHVKLVDPAVMALANSHGLRNIINPVFGYAGLLPANHPLRITIEGIHTCLKKLFWPI